MNAAPTMTTTRPGTTPNRIPLNRIPLNTLAIPLGLTGLAEVWSAGAHDLALPRIVGEAFWIIAGIAWVWMIVAHAVRGARSAAPLSSQLAHPIQGPIAALVPIVGMLLGGNLYGFWPIGGLVLALASIVVAVLYAAWMLSFWMRGELQLENIHGGYFLPTVAGGLVVGVTASQLGLRSLAIGALIAGVFFWLILFAMLIARLALRPALPGPLVPTMAIMLAPPAVAGAAWFGINGGRIDPIEDGLAALTVIMVLLQVALLPLYRRLSFSLGFWSFTFPVAYAAAYALAWLNLLRPAAWQTIAIAIIAGVTVLIAAIGYRSIALAVAGRRTGHPIAEKQLLAADDAAAK
jgi:tellurite resistance protein